MVLIFSTRWNHNTEEDKKVNVISTSKTPAAIWPYSKAILAWDLLFCSWQLWLDPESMNIVKWWIEEETKQVCRNISNLLAEYWLWLKDVVKTTIFLKNIWDFELVNEIYKNYFVLKPARSTVEVSKLPKNALIEIEVIAHKKEHEERKNLMEDRFESIN